MNVQDLKILQSLEADGRQSFSDLAERVSLSKTACWTRVANLEKDGAIVGYGAKLNPRSLGLGVFAIVQVTIDASQRSEFERAVLQEASILECYTTAGNADYSLKVVCRDVDDLDDILRTGISPLPGLQRSSTTVCLKTIKSDGSLTAAARKPI